MVIPSADTATLSLGVLERSRYSFLSRAHQIARADNGETLVGQAELHKGGIGVAPFWNTPGDLEGACYLPYIAKHPTFELAVRVGVLERLQQAQRFLPKTWRIVLKAGYRPYDVQLAVLEAFMQQSRQYHPEWTEVQHLTQARTFVSDPAIVCPAHVTGGAVDVEIEDTLTGLPIDMGCPPNTDTEVAFLFSDRITETQRNHRTTLLIAMLKAGFAPNPYEWWHYQYGDTYWAAFYGHDTTQYDLIKV